MEDVSSLKQMSSDLNGLITLLNSMTNSQYYKNEFKFFFYISFVYIFGNKTINRLSDSLISLHFHFIFQL